MLNTAKLKNASEFDTVFKRGKRLVGAYFAFYYLINEYDRPRLGIVISKRNCALAVNRNRIKRVIREQFRLNRHLLSTIDLVVFLKSSSQKISDQELCACLKKLFSQLIMLCSGFSSN